MAGNTVTRRTPRGCRAFTRAAAYGIAAVAAVAALAGCGSSGAGSARSGPPAPAVARQATPPASAATVVQALAAGQQGTYKQVPWAQVGPGWILAEWTPTLIPPAPISLFLIDPAGGRYLIETFPASPAGSGPATIVAWSGDGRRALFSTGSASATVTVLDLRSLATSQFQLANASPVTFTRPAGEAILVNVQVNDYGQSKLERVSLTGQPQLSYPETFVPGGPYNG